MLAVVSEENFDTCYAYFFYKILCKDENIKACYIGKTRDYKNRVSTHKTNTKTSEIKLYQFIRDNGGFENFTISLIHKCMCDEKSSNYIEMSLIKLYRDKGFEILNIQMPNNLPRAEYNKLKCSEHYSIIQKCECGWEGSKMNYSKHIKTSKKHREHCIKEFEKQLEKKII